MANDKEMHPLSGERVETDGVYRSNYGREVVLKAGEEFPMDPQAGVVEYQLDSFLLHDGRDEILSDERAAAMTGIPITAVNVEEEEAKNAARMAHRRHGGER